jgi:hypothetical protein
MKTKRWNEEKLKNALVDSSSLRQVIKKLGLVEAGGNYEQIKNCIKKLNLDTRHLKGRAWNKGLSGIGKPILPLKDILILNSTYQSYKLKNRLFVEGIFKPLCEMCGWAQKSFDGRIPLELHHVNGDRHDNRISNLKILCPNCHSLQPNYRERNKKIKKHL